MANEIILNEEVIEAEEELVTSSTGKGLKIAAGVGLAALVSVVAYKVGKLVVSKIKEKKELKAAQDAETTTDDAVVSE